MNLKTIAYKKGQEVMAICHYKVFVVMITALHHPLGVIQVLSLEESMEDGTIARLDGVIKMEIHNLIWIQVGF